MTDVMHEEKAKKQKAIIESMKAAKSNMDSVLARNELLESKLREALNLAEGVIKEFVPEYIYRSRGSQEKDIRNNWLNKVGILRSHL